MLFHTYVFCLVRIRKNPDVFEQLIFGETQDIYSNFSIDVHNSVCDFLKMSFQRSLEKLYDARGI